MTEADRLRVGDVERDVAAAALREHFAQGRLTQEELGDRLNTALSARTAGELRTVTADLPAGRESVAAGLGRPTEPERDLAGPGRRSRAGRGWSGPPLPLLMAGFWVVMITTDAWWLLALLPLFFVLARAHRRGHQHWGHQRRWAGYHGDPSDKGAAGR